MLSSKAGLFPILVFGNHILDGHHRWSQFMTTNPNADVNVARVEAPGIRSSSEALGLLHVILYALYGHSPTKPFEGENVYGLDKETIEAIAFDNMAESTPVKLHAAGLIEEPTADRAAEHFANNLSNLKGPGQHPRTVMPQPLDAGDETGMAQTPPEAAAGQINYRAPLPSDIKGPTGEEQMESVSSNDDLVLERWRRLAGII